MIKIAHIIADVKFITQIEKFRSAQIDNKIIYLGDCEELPSSYSSEASCIPTDKENIEHIIALCSEAQIVVVYTLFPKIILGLPKTTIVLWRFFGVELYEKVLTKVLSPETYHLYKKAIKQPSIYSSLKKGLIYLFPQLSSFNRALKRVDYFLGVFEEEYQMLISWGFRLPPFIQIPIRHYGDRQYIPYLKDNTLVVGNSRTFFNNHINIIKMLQATNRPPDLALKMFFSYGGDSAYTDLIRKEAQKLAPIEIIEHFLPKQAFIQIYQRASAVLINSYRQMALGNILIALQSGTKVYLSERNITLQWLQKQGFKVASIEKEFLSDLKIGNLKLSEAEKKGNFYQYLELVESYPNRQFQESIINTIKPSYSDSHQFSTQIL